MNETTTYTLHPNGTLEIGGERIVPLHYSGLAHYSARLICAAAQIEFDEDDEDNEWVDTDGEVFINYLPGYLASLGLQPAAPAIAPGSTALLAAESRLIAFENDLIDRAASLPDPDAEALRDLAARLGDVLDAWRADHGRQPR